MKVSFLTPMTSPDRLLQKPARPAPDISGKDMRESLGKMLARAGAAPAEAEPAPVPAETGSCAGSPAARSPAGC